MCKRETLPYFKQLADTYSMSDNFHQSVNGGTSTNHIMFGHADAIWFSDGNGHRVVPPHNVTVYSGTPDAGVVDEIENPNPAANTNNWYTEDGYGGGGFGSAQYGGGSYTNCSDTTQPGVAPIVNYLHRLQPHIDPHCEALSVTHSYGIPICNKMLPTGRICYQMTITPLWPSEIMQSGPGGVVADD